MLYYLLQNVRRERIKQTKIPKGFMDKRKETEHYESPESKLRAARAFRELGDECASRIETQKAEEAYTLSFALYEELSAELPSPEIKREWAMLCDKMGELYDDTYNFEKEKIYYQQSLRLKRELADTLGTDQSLTELASAYAALADTYVILLHPEDAARCYRQCVTLRKRIAEKMGDDALKQALIRACKKAARVCADNNEAAQAEEYLLMSVEVSEELYRDHGTAETLCALARNLTSLGDLYNTGGKKQEALKRFLRSYELDKKLVAEHPTPRHKGFLAFSCQRVGSTEAELGNEGAAERYLRESMAICTFLTQEAPSIDAYHNVIFACKRLYEVTKGERKRKALIRYFGWAYLQKKNGHDSYGHYKDCITLIEKEFGVTENSPELNELLARFEEIRFDPTV